MKTRSKNADAAKHSEQHLQLAQSNQGGDELAPVLTTPQVGAKPDKLTQLAQDFQKAQEELNQRKLGLQAAYARSIAEVANLGRILIEVKKLAKRKWLVWLERNSSISPKTAQRWMAVARNSSSVSNLTPTTKRLTEHYQDLGILSKKSKEPKPKNGQPIPDDSADSGEDLEKEDDANGALFAKAKNLADRLAQLAVQTSDQDRMAVAVKSFIAWYESYLAMKKTAKEKAEQDAAFDKETSTAAVGTNGEPSKLVTKTKSKCSECKSKNAEWYPTSDGMLFVIDENTPIEPNEVVWCGECATRHGFE